jgi:hypothetical protein
VKLKEADSKPSTAGTQTGSEAGCGRQAGWEQRSPKIIKAHQVEPGGTRGQILYLPGEIFGVRAAKKSAEAVVAMKPRNGGGAKG